MNGTQITQTWDQNRTYPDMWHLRGPQGVYITIYPWDDTHFATSETGYRWQLDELTWAERLSNSVPVPPCGVAKTLAEAQERAFADLEKLLAWRAEQEANRFRQGRLFGGGQ